MEIKPRDTYLACFNHRFVHTWYKLIKVLQSLFGKSSPLVYERETAAATLVLFYNQSDAPCHEPHAITLQALHILFIILETRLTALPSHLLCLLFFLLKKIGYLTLRLLMSYIYIYIYIYTHTHTHTYITLEA